MPTISSFTEELFKVSRGNVDADTHRQRCLLRIVELEEKIRSVKRSYNSVSTTCLLPPEVLSAIFQEVQNSTIEGDDALPKTSAWISVTHVCTQWRQVALTCAALWSTPSFANPNIAALMLERSKQAPLSVIFNQRTDIYIDVVDQALSQIDRVRSVKLIETWTKTMTPSLRKLLNSWTSTAPILQSLCLEGGQRYYDDSHHLPIPFLGGGAPLLERLEFNDIPWGHLERIPAPALKHLHFAYSSREDLYLIPSPVELHGLLSRLPLLRVLTLKLCLPPTTPPLHLTSLRRLELVDNLDNIVNFLEACSLAIDVSMKVSTELDFDEVYCLDLLRRVFKRLFIRSIRNTDNPEPFKLLVGIGAEDDLGLEEDLYRLRLEYAAMNGAGDVGFHMWPLDHAPRPILQALRDELNMSVLTHLSVAEIEDDFDLQVDDWQSIFGNLPLLKTVELLEGCGASNILKALQPDYSMHFPALSTLVVLDDSIREDHIHEMMECRAENWHLIQRFVSGSRRYLQWEDYFEENFPNFVSVERWTPGIQY